MTSNNNPLDVDPINNTSLTGAIQFAFAKMMQNIGGALPARVVAASSDRTRVTVQPLIKMTTTNGDLVSRAQIASVPVMTAGGGGYFLSFNLPTGTLGWIICNDRDISLFEQSYDESPANSNRVKSYSDAFFVPDIMTGYTITEDDAANAVFSNVDGTVKISLTPEGVIITAPTVTIVGALDATAGISVTGGTGGSFTVTGDMNLTGTISVTGTINATGNITAPNIPP